jgi:hypothetical protein
MKPESLEEGFSTVIDGLGVAPDFRRLARYLYMAGADCFSILATRKVGHEPGADIVEIDERGMQAALAELDAIRAQAQLAMEQGRLEPSQQHDDGDHADHRADDPAERRGQGDLLENPPDDGQDQDHDQQADQEVDHGQ